jgi:hypothetical protein
MKKKADPINMNKKLIDLVAPYDAVSIIGMSKNAGKTTVLNKLIAEYSECGIRIGLTSIGRDGENVDVVTGTDKPEIFITKGTIIATAAGLLKKSDVTKEILATTGINTPMGEVVFVRAISDGYVEIGGGSLNSQIAWLCGEFKELGAEKVLVDGAVSRKTVSGPGITDAAVLCAGASLDTDMGRVVDETAFTASLLMLEPLRDEFLCAVLDGLPKEAGKVAAVWPDGSFKTLNLEEPGHIGNGAACICIRGAVSDRVVDKLVMSNINLRNVKIVIEDGSKLFIKKVTFDKLKRKESEIAVRQGINLVAIAINPASARGFSFSKRAFLEAMRERVQIPVFNVLDEERAT